MCLWRKRAAWYDIHSSDRYVSFTLNAFNSTNMINYKRERIFGNRLIINASLIQNDNDIVEIIKCIQQFCPKWLYIQPFLLKKIITVGQNNNLFLPTSIRYIETVGELLPSELRIHVTEFLNISLANMYGAEELNCIAYECPNNHFHVMDDNVYLEVAHDAIIHSEGTGRAIVTSLYSYAMPIIRYDLNDVITKRPLSNNCFFSSSNTEISIIYGRKNTCIDLTDSVSLNSFFLMEIITEINNRFSDIIQEYYYVYVRDKQSLTCYILIDATRCSWFESIKSELICLFKEKTMGAIFNFDVYPLPKTHDYSHKNTILVIE